MGFHLELGSGRHIEASRRAHPQRGSSDCGGMRVSGAASMALRKMTSSRPRSSYNAAPTCAFHS